VAAETLDEGMEKGNMQHLGKGFDPKIVAFPGASGAPPKLDRAALASLLGSRVRTLQVVCGAMLGSAVMLAGASFVAVRSVTVPPQVSTQVSLILTVTAVVILLAASRLHATLLARAGRGAAAASNPQVAASAVLDAYGRATVISYVLLDATASLGLVIAVVTCNVRYSLVICAVAVLAMLARWPHMQAVLGLLRRRGLA
jgi:hypothetical protein